MRAGYAYYERAGALNRSLKQAIPVARIKALHHKQPIRHFAIAARQLLLLVACPVLIYHLEAWWIRLPLSVLMGFVIFSFSVLLHEAVHKAIFNRDPKDLTAKLGFVYGIISGLAPAQFTKWHMDHHNNLGSEVDDPKRAHLSPKRNARWYKLLYMTPALFPIYFRAAAKAAERYPEPLRRKIKTQRRVAMGLHISWLLAAWLLVSPVFAFWVSIFPVFFVFPVAFTINRLGQHYVIDPDDVAAWSTLMRPSPIWNFLYLYSSYHLEHHYFPAVPFYRLKALQRELDPFYAERGIVAMSYAKLLKVWFLDNHEPHTRRHAGAEQNLAPAAKWH